MSGPRDMLMADPSRVLGMSVSDIQLLSSQIIGSQMDTLSRILRELQKQNPSVKATAIVSGTQQNNITDTDDHEVTFEVGGSRGLIHRLLLFSTYDQVVVFNEDSTANGLDGIPFSATNVLDLHYPGGLGSVHVRARALSATSLFVNGPSDIAHGGFFMYGWTIPVYDRERM